jgi:flagellar protein FlbD
LEEGEIVIKFTRLDGTVLYVNPELIQTIEPTPQPVITLTTDIKFVAKESAEEIVSRIMAYRIKIHSGSLPETGANK